MPFKLMFSDVSDTANWLSSFCGQIILYYNYVHVCISLDNKKVRLDEKSYESGFAI